MVCLFRGFRFFEIKDGRESLLVERTLNLDTENNLVRGEISYELGGPLARD